MKKSFTNQLAFRLTTPVIVLWLLAGVSMYVLVMNTVSDFLQVHIKGQFQWYSNDVFDICSKHLDTAIMDNKSSFHVVKRIHQARALADIEDFFREQNLKGAVYQRDNDLPPTLRLAVGLPATGWEQRIPPGKLLSVKSFSLENKRYFTYSMSFPQWNWRIVLISETTPYAAFRREMTRTFLLMGALLSIAALLVLFATNKFVRRPIKHIVTQLERRQQPTYKGVYELEFLSNRIRDMMAAQESMNKILEEQVTTRTMALENKASELEDANVRLKALDKLKSSFLSSVSHELRTPLTSILGFAKIINKTYLKHFSRFAEENEALQRKDSLIKEDLRIIEQEGKRLTRLINDVLDLNRIESGEMVWNNQRVDIHDHLNAALDSTRMLFKGKPDVSLRLDIQAPLPALYIDPDRLMQVLTNLIGNSAKFTDHGEVVVAARPSGIPGAGVVRISVSDTGVGIPEEDLPDIFDAFHQAVKKDALVDKPKGTGLGLAICKEIVEHYHGGIWVESTPGKGSSFVFELPAVE